MFGGGVVRRQITSLMAEAESKRMSLRRVAAVAAEKRAGKAGRHQEMGLATPMSP
jgi:hypothetical protein